MKINKQVLALFVLIAVMAFTSCMGISNDDESYGNSYGYVHNYDGTLYVATSAGYLITWDGISDELKTGECVMVSFTIDSSAGHSLSDSTYYYNATDVEYSTDLNTYTLSSDDPITQIDSNYVTSTSVVMYYYTAWFGDNWFLKYYTKTTNGKDVTPLFYYSTSAADSFDVENGDSLFIDMRLQISGTRDTASVTTTHYGVVDLSPIRTMFESSGNYAGEYIPIYFRYYTGKKTHSTSSETAYGMYIGE